MKNLVGRKAKISADNDNYDTFRDKVLIITYASNDENGNGYDTSVYPQMLCDFKCEDGTEFPFAFYEYEFTLLK